MRAAAGVALVVVAVVLVVKVAVVNVVDVVVVNDGDVPAARAVRVVVGLGGTVLGRGGHAGLLSLGAALCGCDLVLRNHKMMIAAAPNMKMPLT